MLGKPKSQTLEVLDVDWPLQEQTLQLSSVSQVSPGFLWTLLWSLQGCSPDSSTWVSCFLWTISSIWASPSSNCMWSPQNFLHDDNPQDQKISAGWRLTLYRQLREVHRYICCTDLARCRSHSSLCLLCQHKLGTLVRPGTALHCYKSVNRFPLMLIFENPW